jgi:hypothetical protein
MCSAQGYLSRRNMARDQAPERRVSQEFMDFVVPKLKAADQRKFAELLDREGVTIGADGPEERIAGAWQLYERGATAGERQAAAEALKRMGLDPEKGRTQQPPQQRSSRLPTGRWSITIVGPRGIRVSANVASRGRQLSQILDELKAKAAAEYGTKPNAWFVERADPVSGDQAAGTVNGVEPPQKFLRLNKNKITRSFF